MNTSRPKKKHNEHIRLKLVSLKKKIKISQLQVACAHIFHNRTQEINGMILLTNKSYIIFTL